MQLHSELANIQAKLLDLDGEITTKHEAADALVREFQAQGVDPLRDETAFAKVDAAYKDADALREQASKLRDQASNLIVRTGGGRLDSRGLGPGSAPFGALSTDAMRTLHEAAARGQFHRVAPHAAITVGNFPPADRVDYDLGVHSLLRERVRIADYIPREGIDTVSKTYYRVTTGATGAASVAAGADKPESSPVLEAVTVDVVKVAHYGLIDDEILKDYAAWSDVVGLEFVSGLVGEENTQILTASGVGEDMVGLLETPNILTYTRDTTNQSRLDALARGDAALRTGAAFCEPTLRIMHPNDYVDTLLEKDQTMGTYLAGDPTSSQHIDFWGVPTVVTTDMTEGTAIVANLALAAKIYWREDATFEAHPNGGGLAEWKANRTLVRAEERFVLAVVRPAAICAVELL